MGLSVSLHSGRKVNMIESKVVAWSVKELSEVARCCEGGCYRGVARVEQGETVSWRGRGLPHKCFWETLYLHEAYDLFRRLHPISLFRPVVDVNINPRVNMCCQGSSVNQET